MSTKRTYQPSKRRRTNRFGFRALKRRKRARGKLLKVFKRRMAKGRALLSPSM